MRATSHLPYRVRPGAPPLKTGGSVAIKDSGATRTFESGFHRDAADAKPRFSLIPIRALRRVAAHYTAGADKYGGNNWRRACTDDEWLVFMDSALRHVYDALEGKHDEDHLAAAVWNLMGAMDTGERLAVGRTDWSSIAERETAPRG